MPSVNTETRPDYAPEVYPSDVLMTSLCFLLEQSNHPVKIAAEYDCVNFCSGKGNLYDTISFNAQDF